MYANEYGEVVARWKVEFIRTRARRLGFREDEIPDLEQDIVLELLQVDFEEVGSACEATFVTHVIDLQLRKVLRDRKRDVRRLNHEATSYEDLSEDARIDPSETERIDFRLDLEAAMASLSPEEKALFEALRRGDSQAEIAGASGKPKTTVSDAVRRLRKKLRALGLDAYLE